MLLVFANKQDMPNAMAVSELTDKLGLQALRSRTVSAAGWEVVEPWVGREGKARSSQEQMGGWMLAAHPVRSLRK